MSEAGKTKVDTKKALDKNKPPKQNTKPPKRNK